MKVFKEYVDECAKMVGKHSKNKELININKTRTIIENYYYKKRYNIILSFQEECGELEEDYHYAIIFISIVFFKLLLGVSVVEIKELGNE